MLHASELKGLFLKTEKFQSMNYDQPTSRTNETHGKFGTDCSNTFLLMQTYEESLAEVKPMDESNSHSCTLKGGCWKKMR